MKTFAVRLSAFALAWAGLLVLPPIAWCQQPTFATPTSYVDDIDRVLEELKNAAR